MWFAAYFITTVAFCLAGGLALVSGLDWTPTTIAACLLMVDMAIIRFAP